MKVIESIWENVWGLFFDDGQLAVGILVTIAVTWATGAYGGEGIHNQVGWLMLGLLVVLVLANLYVVGVKAQRRITTTSPH